MGASTTLYTSPRKTTLRARPRSSASKILEPAVLWLLVLSLSLLGPLVCIIHCTELERAQHGTPTRALYTCQLFGDSAPSSQGGQHSSPALPDSAFSLLRAFYVLLVAHQPDAVAPLLAVAFVCARRLPFCARLADAPPTPPPRRLAAV